MLGYYKRLLTRAKRQYQKDEDGVAAIEFAILALPFFMLVFGIIELAIIFFINSTMAHGVNEAGRQIRTGNFQACGGAAKFKELVCNNMDNLMDCKNSVRIDVVSAPSFKDIVVPDPEAPDGGPIPQGDYANTNAGDPVVIRSLFYYKLALPNAFTRLESIPGSGYRVMSTTTAFRNEPFPAPGACPT